MRRQVTAIGTYNVMALFHLSFVYDKKGKYLRVNKITFSTGSRNRLKGQKIFSTFPNMK
jgi:hypothetical protein